MRERAVGGGIGSAHIPAMQRGALTSADGRPVLAQQDIDPSRYPAALAMVKCIYSGGELQQEVVADPALLYEVGLFSVGTLNTLP